MGFPEISKDLGTPYQNVFDGKLDTYFSGNKNMLSWAGLDLGKPVRITKVKYCPRSDTNFILPGDTYELCCWDGNRWQSLGKQSATEQKVVWKGIPSNGVYLLHDLSGGKEERIFTYENGKQVWW